MKLSPVGRLMTAFLAVFMLLVGFVAPAASADEVVDESAATQTLEAVVPAENSNEVVPAEPATPSEEVPVVAEEVPTIIEPAPPAPAPQPEPAVVPEPVAPETVVQAIPPVQEAEETFVPPPHGEPNPGPPPTPDLNEEVLAEELVSFAPVVNVTNPPGQFGWFGEGMVAFEPVSGFENGATADYRVEITSGPGYFLTGSSNFDIATVSGAFSESPHYICAINGVSIITVTDMSGAVIDSFPATAASDHGTFTSVPKQCNPSDVPTAPADPYAGMTASITKNGDGTGLVTLVNASGQSADFHVIVAGDFGAGKVTVAAGATETYPLPKNLAGAAYSVKVYPYGDGRASGPLLAEATIEPAPVEEELRSLPTYVGSELSFSCDGTQPIATWSVTTQTEGTGEVAFWMQRTYARDLVPERDIYVREEVYETTGLDTRTFVRPVFAGEIYFRVIAVNGEERQGILPDELGEAVVPACDEDSKDPVEPKPEPEDPKNPPADGEDGQFTDEPKYTVVDQNGNWDICHATGSASNPYVQNSPSINSIIKGEGHGGHEGDIIPPFSWEVERDGKVAYGNYEGNQWNEVNEAIFNNDCKVVEEKPEDPKDPVVPKPEPEDPKDPEEPVTPVDPQPEDPKDPVTPEDPKDDEPKDGDAPKNDDGKPSDRTSDDKHVAGNVKDETGADGDTASDRGHTVQGAVAASIPAPAKQLYFGIAGLALLAVIGTGLTSVVRRRS